MDIVVNEALKAYIDPLTEQEYEALERSIVAEGCRDALVLWGDVLVDGHNRYGICQKHGLPFSTIQATQFKSMDDVHLWMIDQHLGRRSISDFQRGVLALRKRDILEQRMQQAAEHRPHTSADDDTAPSTGETPSETASELPHNTQILHSREALAKAARISSNQVRMIEAIQAQAAPEVVAAVKAGDLSLNAAAAVATLPAQEQVQAAHGGAKELKQAAKRAREAKRKPKSDEQAAEGASRDDLGEGQTAPSDAGDTASTAAPAHPRAGVTTETPADVQALRERVQALETENEHLRAQVAQLQALLPAPF
jgi:hypothetical protein